VVERVLVECLVVERVLVERLLELGLVGEQRKPGGTSGGVDTDPLVPSQRVRVRRARRASPFRYSHSIVAGGFDEMS
jgi:hypothetical protein